MLSVFECFEESESLYFKLNNSLHIISAPCSDTYKIAGIYAIYRGDVCHYVGQSKNLPSRIATHLKGKYKNADRVELFFAGEEMHENANPFHDWHKDDQKETLERNEAYLIHELHPIENIYIPDMQDCDELWLIDPDMTHATIDVDRGIYTVYRCPFSLSSASNTLKRCYEMDVEYGRGVNNA